MSDPRVWLAELTLIAPACDQTLLRVVAGMLAGEACPDAMLIVGDALRDAEALLRLDGCDRLAAEIRTLHLLLDGELEIRRVRWPARESAPWGSFW